MQYEEIKCESDIAKVMYADSVVWEQPPIQLTPKVRFGESTSWIQAEIAVPTNKKGYVEIALNYKWLQNSNCSDLEFRTSDSRYFGWAFNPYPKKYGSNDGISGSPQTKIKVESLEKPLSSISIKFALWKNATYDDLKTIGVTAIYVVS